MNARELLLPQRLVCRPGTLLAFTVNKPFSIDASPALPYDAHLFPSRRPIDDVRSWLDAVRDLCIYYEKYVLPSWQPSSL